MDRQKLTTWATGTAIERLPWAARALLGCAAAALAVALTYTIPPLRAFPLLLAFPTVILSAWFLGMGGGMFCAISEAVLVDAFLTKAQERFSVGNAREEVRLAVFLTISILLGWIIRRLARQRADLVTRGLEQRLALLTTERQLAEERAQASEALRDRDAKLQLALEANGMGLWVWDVPQGTLHWSDEVYRLLGREPGTVEADFDSWLAMIHPDDRVMVSDAGRAVLSDPNAPAHSQHRVVWPDGAVHWVESLGKRQLDSDGGLLRVVGVLSDITHRKRAEDAMLRAEKLAIAGRLAASVAHEINNPLEAVSNLLFLISLTESPAVAQEHAREAMDQLMRVSMITQQTLKFHRQTGAPRLAILSEILSSVLGMFRGKLRAAEIAVDLDAQREAEVSCMPSEAQQIFANLISNSIDAMPAGGRLSIRLRPSRHWRDRRVEGMRITFHDSGVGMDRATMKRIFEPFFTTKADTGTGLGMWVVAQLVDRHHGQVSVRSTQRDGRSGTAFSVFLPFELNAAKIVEETAPQSSDTLARAID